MVNIAARMHILAWLFIAIQSAYAISGRYSHSSIYLPGTKQFVVYGGRQQASNRPPSVLVMSLPTGNPADMLTTEYFFSNKSDPLASLRDVSAGYDANSNLVLLFGYDSARNESTNSVSTLSVASNKIASSLIEVAAAKPSPRFNAASTNFNSSYIFVQGGTSEDDNASNSSGIYKPMSGAYLYSTETKTFSILPEPLPPARWHHTATDVGNKVILLGGTSNQVDTFDFYDIWVYTEANSFKYVTATGDGPDPRRAHTAVACKCLLNSFHLILSDGKKVIVYGGTDSTFLNLYDSVYELDTETYNWRKLYPLDDVEYSVSPPGRYSHTAHVVGDQMFILFGFSKNPNSTVPGAGYADSSIHVFDLKQNSWSFSAEAGSKKFLTVPTAPENNSNIGVIIGSIFAALIVVGLVVLGVIWYSRKKDKKDRDLEERLDKLRDDSQDEYEPRVSSDQYSFVDTHPSMRVNRPGQTYEPATDEYANMPPMQQYAQYEDADLTPRASMLR